MPVQAASQPPGDVCILRMRFNEKPLSAPTRRGRQRRSDDRRRTVDDETTEPSSPEPLIVLSNRQPYRHEYDEAADAGSLTDADRSVRADGASAERSIAVDEPTGGLTAGLDPVLQRANGTWIAWGDGDADFAVTDGDQCVAVPPDEESYTLRRVDLCEEAVDSYYYGFSNQVLWPLCHEFPDRIATGGNDFDWYRTVNERFADAVGEHATEDAVVWVQDYHFALAPRMIDERVPESATVAHFWHIPWPSPATFRHCPAGRQLLEGLLGNDLLGFHVDRYVENFLDCVDREFPDASVDRDRRRIRYRGRTTHVVATPMGVDADAYDRDADAVDADQLASLLERHAIPPENFLALGVDRLDYSKGIPERLAGIERFLERNPGLHGEFTYLQVATPSRTDIPAYQRHGDLVRSEVRRLESRFGTDDWRPVVYTEDYVSNEDLCALYRHADTMVVSPLVDGMNLVAQEYVAASVDGDGTLLLSDRTGAHERLGADALTIDPTDAEFVARQLESAVSMPPGERRDRMNAMREDVFEGDLESWMRTQFDLIERVHDDGPTDLRTGPGPGSREYTHTV